MSGTERDLVLLAACLLLLLLLTMYGVWQAGIVGWSESTSSWTFQSQGPRHRIVQSSY
jgi:hypothetical protein